MKFKIIFTLSLSLMFFINCNNSADNKEKDNIITDNNRHRVIVTSDIGGTDPDDFQSMVHLLVYADTLDIEGLIFSPYGLGRKEHILQVIGYYEQDYPNLKTYSDKYPTPYSLRAITKQGGIETPGPVGVGTSTEGSNWIIECARRDDPRPLHVLVWGGIEDLAQALHDAQEILPKLRVYFIGGPNKKWSVNAYRYIATNHRDLWIIESNATYRGWFTGGDQSGEWGNSAFVTTNIAEHGALGNFFNSQLGGTIKMGDTPSVGWLLRGTQEYPSQPSWGGKFVRAWKRPHVVFDRVTSASDRIEEFGVLELNLPLGSGAPSTPTASMQVENQLLAGLIKSDDTVQFLFSPKAAKTYSYTLQSDIPDLTGKKGSITSYIPPEENKLHPSPDVMEGEHIGAKTVNQWRVEYLSDFATRMDRCK